MMASKMSGHSCVGIVLDVKVVTLEPATYLVPGFSTIFYIEYTAFYEINEITALANGQPVVILLFRFSTVPDWEIPVQYLPRRRTSAQVTGQWPLLPL